MLEELQRLQAHIGVLKTRLAHFESENSTLNAAKLDADRTAPFSSCAKKWLNYPEARTN